MLGSCTLEKDGHSPVLQENVFIAPHPTPRWQDLTPTQDIPVTRSHRTKAYTSCVDSIRAHI